MRISVEGGNPFLACVIARAKEMPLAEDGRLARFDLTASDSSPPQGTLFLTSKLPGFLGEGALFLSARVPSGAIGDYAYFGLRELKPQELRLLTTKRAQAYTMREISREGLSEVTDACMAYVRRWPSWILVVDLSVVDPAFAPGLAAPAAGGLSARELVYAVQRLGLVRGLSSAVLVVDTAHEETLTELLAAKLLTELAVALETRSPSEDDP
jgi:arginase family enzyme